MMDEVKKVKHTAYRRGRIPRSLWSVSTVVRRESQYSFGSTLLWFMVTMGLILVILPLLIFQNAWVLPTVGVLLVVTAVALTVMHKRLAVPTELPVQYNHVYRLLSPSALEGLEGICRGIHPFRWSEVVDLTTDPEYRPLADEILSIVAATEHPQTPQLAADALGELHAKLVSKRREVATSSPSFAKDIAYIVERG